MTVGNFLKYQLIRSRGTRIQITVLILTASRIVLTLSPPAERGGLNKPCNNLHKK